jgi:serine/threonine-protein kinase RsbW
MSGVHTAHAGVVVDSELGRVNSPSSGSNDEPGRLVLPQRRAENARLRVSDPDRLAGSARQKCLLVAAHVGATGLQVENHRGAVRASLSLRTDAEELRRVIHFAESFARHHALSRAERARLLIILEELFTNAVKHGGDGAARGGKIEIALALEAGRLTIEFSDVGRPFDPLSLPLPDFDRSATQRPIGGLGVHIVRSFVHEGRYFRDGDRNHLELVRRIARPDRGNENG